MITHTLYAAIPPAYTNFTVVYAIPYPMKQGQSPRDIERAYQSDWRAIARINSRGELVYIDPLYAAYADDVAGFCGDTWMHVQIEG